MYFVWGLIGLILIVVSFMPKRLTVRDDILVFSIVGYLAWVSHILVGVKWDLLDFGPTKKIEYTDFALVSFVPPLLAILFLNFKKENQSVLYAIIWTVLSIALEFILAMVGYMKHTEWKIWYSIPVYFIAYFGLQMFYKKVIKSNSD
jgi:lysylphosphatidylglycerol synthetase-like protein (DUF2156 family)